MHVWRAMKGYDLAHVRSKRRESERERQAHRLFISGAMLCRRLKCGFLHVFVSEARNSVCPLQLHTSPLSLSLLLLPLFPTAAHSRAFSPPSCSARHRMQPRAEREREAAAPGPRCDPRMDLRIRRVPYAYMCIYAHANGLGVHLYAIAPYHTPAPC